MNHEEVINDGHKRCVGDDKNRQYCWHIAVLPEEKLEGVDDNC